MVDTELVDSCIILEGDLSVDSVMARDRELRQKVQQCAHSELRIDLSRVGHCDSAGLALLIDIKRHVKQQGKQLILIGLPAQTKALAEFCGVDSLVK